MQAKKRVQYRLEYPIKASLQLLYSYISTPEGLSEWFADSVDPIKNDEYVFKWQGSQQTARILKIHPNKNIRYQWEEGPKDEYFELGIIQDDLTGDVAMVIEDFSSPEDLKESEMLWESQVHHLKEIIGG